jgi:HSP20 family molecular chaperone IbpA
VAQTASEKAAAAASAAPGERAPWQDRGRDHPPDREREPLRSAQAQYQRPQYQPHVGREPEHGQDHGHERRAYPWMQRLPTLPELWNLWQQPLRMMRRASHDMERVFDSVLTQPGSTRAGPQPRQDGARGAWTPVVETAQREQKFVVCAELPGVRCDDLQVEIKHDRLTIEGERRPEPPHEAQEERHSERRYGHFYRVVALPAGAQPDSAAAEMHDGVLEITVPLAAYANRPRRLDVKPGRPE